MVQSVQRFPHGQVQKVALVVLYRNAYFSHPENQLIVLGILCDEDKDVHRIAVNKIQSIKKRSLSMSNYKISR